MAPGERIRFLDSKRVNLAGEGSTQGIAIACGLGVRDSRTVALIVRVDNGSALGKIAHRVDQNIPVGIRRRRCVRIRERIGSQYARVISRDDAHGTEKVHLSSAYGGGDRGTRSQASDVNVVSLLGKILSSNM